MTASLAAADSTQLDIHVTTESGRPVDNASVVIKFKGTKIKPNPNQKEWDVKTSQEGIIKLPTIQKGPILIQIRADNFQTFGQVFDVQEDERLWKSS